jgi:hypothetical protein
LSSTESLISYWARTDILYLYWVLVFLLYSYLYRTASILPQYWHPTKILYWPKVTKSCHSSRLKIIYTVLWVQQVFNKAQHMGLYAVCLVEMKYHPLYSEWVCFYLGICPTVWCITIVHRIKEWISLGEIAITQKNFFSPGHSSVL